MTMYTFTHHNVVYDWILWGCLWQLIANYALHLFHLMMLGIRVQLCVEWNLITSIVKVPHITQTSKKTLADMDLHTIVNISCIIWTSHREQSRSFDDMIIWLQPWANVLSNLWTDDRDSWCLASIVCIVCLSVTMKTEGSWILVTQSTPVTTFLESTPQ